MRKVLALAAGLLASVHVSAAAPVLIDFSEPSRAVPYKLSGTLQKAILSSLFASYVDDYDKCPADGSGVYIATINSSVRGTFSESASEQVVVALSAQGCDEGRAGKTGYIVLVEDGKVVSSVEGAGTEIQMVFDQDGDGLSEVIATDGGTWQGYTNIYADTYTFKGSRAAATNLVDGIVAMDDCGVQEDKGTEIVAVFFKRSESPVTVYQKNYVKACGAPNSQFKFHSDGELQGY